MMKGLHWSSVSAGSMDFDDKMYERDVLRR